MGQVEVELIRVRSPFFFAAFLPHIEDEYVTDLSHFIFFRLDEEMIESLFGYKINNSVKPEEYHSKSPSPSKHVLDPKRLQNITILSKALNATYKEVCDALVEGDTLVVFL